LQIKVTEQGIWGAIWTFGKGGENVAKNLEHFIFHEDAEESLCSNVLPGRLEIQLLLARGDISIPSHLQGCPAMYRQSKGFSLIELLIVVAIILIIAAIAIPNLLRARIAANESSAVGSLRAINTAQVTYGATYPSTGFAYALSFLGGTGTDATYVHALLLDTVLACPNSFTPSTPCPKSGYNFVISNVFWEPDGSVSGYQTTAMPITVDQTGKRYFFSDSSGVIRYNTSAIATVTDAPLQ
jgi:prepilin-type N-terminal cleavage/methylation domain-containing protein